MADVKLIARLRAETGAPMGDCTSALAESNGDIEKAKDILRKRGAVKAVKRAGKIAAEGVVTSYIHAGGKIGVLVELNCETDFVAKTDKFQDLARGIAMHIAASNPLYVVREDVPSEVVSKEKEIYIEQLKTEGKPAEVIEKIVTGKLGKYFSEVCLMEQLYIKDDSKTITTLLTEAVAEIGEKITVRRFARYELGEGIERGEKCDFAAEVEAQLKA